MAVDYSAYEGMSITGGVSTVLARGSVVVADGEFHGREGHGRFLSRELSQYLV
jgi:dihydropyrimidinase